MLVDWMTNLWNEDHVSRDLKQAGGTRDATPDKHEENVLATADSCVVTTLSGLHLGIHVPNDFVAEYIRKHPGRAVGLATVDPMDPEALPELERAIRDLGLHGLKLAPTYQNFDPWAPEAWAVYDLANDLGIPIYWHQSAGGASSPLEFADPVKIDKIARTYPGMKMMLEHFALPWGNIAVALARKHEQVYVDVCARVVRTWDMYSCLRLAIDYGVTGKVLFGSDFPIQSTEQAMASLRVFSDPNFELKPIPEAEIESIIYNRPLDLIWENV